MSSTPARCLILACGNTLRGDDGVGLWLAEWAERRFAGMDGVRVVARQQWTPELAEDVACADSVLFIDCSVDSAPGSVRVMPVALAPDKQGLTTHHSGAESTELGEGLSNAVNKALPEACRLVEETVVRLFAL
jgi:hydrogenase maturation protease